MSTLWHAKVVTVDGSRCVLELTVVHPDAGPVKADHVFALRLLAEVAVDEELDGSRTPCGPLGEQLQFGEAESTSWCEKHGSAYLTSVQILALPAAGDTNWRYAKRSTAQLEIVVTDPRWLAHLSRGQTWDSTAFS